MIDHHQGILAQLRLAIPTVEQIADGVADIPHRMMPRPWLDGPRTFLTITAGAVRLSTRHTPGADTGSQFGYSAARTRAAAARGDQDVTPAENVRVDEVDAFLLNQPMALVDPTPPPLLPFAPIPKRGAVLNWSRRSRARAEFRLQSLDWSPLFDQDTQAIPGMVTFTMPGRHWEECTPTARDFKNKIVAFKAAYLGAWGKSAAGAWKMEFQKRGAPHVHILMTPPVGLSADRRLHAPAGTVPEGRLVWTESGELVSDNTGGLYFPAWLSLTWARIVGVHKLVDSPVGWEPTDAFPTWADDRRAAFLDHVRAGTGIDRRDIDKYLDPRRIARYFIKHGAFAAKEYQNEMPQLWLDAIAAGAPSGNFWGYWALEPTDATVELNTCADSGLMWVNANRTKDTLSVICREGSSGVWTAFSGPATVCCSSGDCRNEPASRRSGTIAPGCSRVRAPHRPDCEECHVQRHRNIRPDDRSQEFEQK